MHNPFEDLGKPKPAKPEGIPFEGSFACQEFGCEYVVLDARYLREVELLTWKCPSGHVSTIKGFRI